MEPHDTLYGQYLSILREELIPATGCTEPIALAYAAAKARQALGRLPERLTAEVCGNIIKNVKSVVVPNTGGQKGVAAAIAAGAVAGDPDNALEALSHLSEDDVAAVRDYLQAHEVRVLPAHNGKIFYLSVTAAAGADEARAVIEDHHTNLTVLEKNGVPLPIGDTGKAPCGELTDRSCLSVAAILDFADTVALDDVRALILRQAAFNSAIAEEGVRNPWGAEIGRVLLAFGDDPATRARAMAAAGSDARMGGCDMPVVIVSGSGNQGMTASLPVIEYAKTLGSSEERLIRALVLSDLVTIHQKTPIGRLSAFCGAVSAGCGAAAGIAYLHGGDFRVIAHTIVNTLAILSGMVCDGAKPSCAAKIASAVDAGILGYRMVLRGQQFRDGEGIIVKGVEHTIENIGRMAHDGMRETDREIIDIMTGCGGKHA